MKEDALIIFVRKPELGKVKTRLAKELGNQKALEIYKLLLTHTKKIAQPLDVEKYVYYASEIDHHDLWSSGEFQKALQIEGDLGEKMNAAFNDIFLLKCKKVCIIGSDCKQLSTEILQQAFQILDHNDVVIGPTEDGGYYLLGMKQTHPTLFQDVNWSTNTVFRNTVTEASNLKLSIYQLPKLFDIDYKEDWERMQSLL